MTKVKVTREVAEALEECERNYISTDLTLVFHVQKGLTGKFAPLQTLSISELATALIIGYEVEETPEDAIRKYYERSQAGLERALRFGYIENEYHAKGTAHGVKTTLNLLGIKIGGINA